MNAPESEWLGRARREAAAILDECGYIGPGYESMVSLAAISWLQGVNYGSHATLHEAEAAFARMQAELT